MESQQNNISPLKACNIFFDVRFNLIFWTLIAVSVWLILTGTFADPGGPFISLYHTIMPVLLLSLAATISMAGFRRQAKYSRIFRLIYLGICLILIALVILSVYVWFHEPWARGQLFGL